MLIVIWNRVLPSSVEKVLDRSSPTELSVQWSSASMFITYPHSQLAFYLWRWLVPRWKQTPNTCLFMNRQAMVLEEHRIDGIFEVMRSKVELCNILMLTLTSGCSTQMVKHKTRALLTKSGRDHMKMSFPWKTYLMVTLVACQVFWAFPWCN